MFKAHDCALGSRDGYIYYIYVCHASAHAQDNNNNYYLYVQWVAMVFLVYFPRRFGMQLPLVAMVLREASALMRSSSKSAVPADPGDRGGRPSCARPRTDAPRSGFAGTRHPLPPARTGEETARPRSASPLRDRTLPDAARQTQPLEPILFPKLRIRFADFPYLHCSID